MYESLVSDIEKRSRLMNGKQKPEYFLNANHIHRENRSLEWWEFSIFDLMIMSIYVVITVIIQNVVAPET